MNKKHFVFGHDTPVTKEELMEAQQEKEARAKTIDAQREQNNQKAISSDHKLKAVEGRVVIKINTQLKNFHTFQDGTKIRYERQFDNFNRRHTEPVNAIVIDGEGISKGAEILIHPNGVHDSYLVTDYDNENIATDVKIYSIPEAQCFIWKDDNGVWQPIKPFETALRVFTPYSGIITAIEPEQIKDTLYVTSGRLKGLIVKTLPACDYEIIFQDSNGKEASIIRFRPDGDEKTEREPEAIAIMNELTRNFEKGELRIGISPKEAKTIQEYGA